MKKVLIGFIILLMFPLIKVTAQNQNLEKINAYKIGFYTKRLNLTPEEAEKFWPVYNEYQKQKSMIQVEKMSVIRNFNQNETALSDNQLAEMGDKLIADIVQESALAMTFHKKLKVVLPPAKVIRFYQAENQYKVQLLNELQGAKQPQRQRPLRNF